MTIPSSVTEIGGGVFNGCSKLVDVYCYAINPPRIDVSWKSFDDGVTLHVPKASLSQYRAQYWSYGEVVALTDEEMGIKDISMIVATKYVTFYDSRSAYILPSGLNASVVTGMNNGKLT